MSFAPPRRPGQALETPRQTPRPPPFGGIFLPGLQGRPQQQSSTDPMLVSYKIVKRACGELVDRGACCRLCKSRLGVFSTHSGLPPSGPSALLEPDLFSVPAPLEDVEHLKSWFLGDGAPLTAQRRGAVRAPAVLPRLTPLRACKVLAAGQVRRTIPFQHKD